MDENAKELLDEVSKKITKAAEIGFCQGLSYALRIIEDAMKIPEFSTMSGDTGLMLTHLVIKEELTKLKKELNMDEIDITTLGNTNVH